MFGTHTKSNKFIPLIIFHFVTNCSLEGEAFSMGRTEVVKYQVLKFSIINVVLISQNFGGFVCYIVFKNNTILNEVIVGYYRSDEETTIIYRSTFTNNE